VTADLSAILEEPGRQFYQGPWPTPAHWARLRAIASAVATGDVTYVHCLSGISRSTMAVVFALMQLDRLKAADALDFVHERRPSANPGPAFRAILHAMDWRVPL
jgi:protein-tyrosine phosphatase